MTDHLDAASPLRRVRVDPNNHWFRPWATVFGRDGSIRFVPIEIVDVEAEILERYHTVSGRSAWSTTWVPPAALAWR